MKSLWTYIERKNWNADTKYRVAILILGALFALAGFAAWLIIRIWALSTLDWMICFIGYPAAFAPLVVLLHGECFPRHQE